MDDCISWSTEKQGCITLPSQVAADGGQGSHLPGAWWFLHQAHWSSLFSLYGINLKSGSGWGVLVR